LLLGSWILALAPSGPAAHAGAPAPRIEQARCVPTEKCVTDPHQVAPGGTLALTGTGLKRSQLVLFKRGSGRTITSKLRRSRQGLIVAVPTVAMSGRIRVIDGKRRSNAFGPIRVVKPPPPVPQPKASGTPFDGTGMWIWYLNKSDGGDLDAIAARAHSLGITTLFIKSGDGSTYWSQFSPLTIAGLKQRGLNVCAWQFVYGNVPEDEAAVAAQAVQSGAQCFVVDAESEYRGRYAAAQTYMQRLRAAIPPGFPVALTSFPYVDYHPGLPYSVFLGPGAADYNLPQIYWQDIGTSVDNAIQHTYIHNRIYGKPILPLGQSYSDPPPEDIYRFRQITPLYGSSGVSFWSWQASTERGWQAIGAPLQPLTDYVPSQDYPLLAKGRKGDEVLWMQEHLAGAQPTPLNGTFDAATDSALRNFQTQRGLPVTGQTDSATWQALLALTPVAVDWTTTAQPASRSARAARKREIPVLGRR
jgi:peptidoglycan hydrolase-like protein with peptidoglycan-binding domain